MIRRVLAAGLGSVVAIVIGTAPWSQAAQRAPVRTSRAATTSSTTTTTTTTTPTPAITLRAKPSHVIGSHDVVLTGTTTPSSRVQLFRSPHPQRSFTSLTSTTSAADGSFSFTVHPDRITRYRALLVGTNVAALVTVKVAVRVLYKLKAIPLGQAKVTLVLFHPRDLHWGKAKVHWDFGHGRKGRFTVKVTTRSHKLSPYVVVLSTTATLPAGRYHWRACFRVPGDHALADPKNPIGCKGMGFWGRGRLPEGYPGSHAIARAARYLSSRAGRLAFAVVDSEGRESGVHEHWTFVSASVVKAMLLVAYLRRLDAHGQHSIDSYSNSFLYPMINVSDNNAATQTWSIVGDSGLYAVAHAAGMQDFSIVGIWANAQISAYDQAKFFFEMDSLIPHEFVGYARHLLSTIAAYESWGIPAIARPRGYNVFFKGGWRGTGLGQLVHQIGRLEGHKRVFSIAVMTDGDPSMGYGIDTIQGVTASLL